MLLDVQLTKYSRVLDRARRGQHEKLRRLFRLALVAVVVEIVAVAAVVGAL